jgi:hypothetical protein
MNSPTMKGRRDAVAAAMYFGNRVRVVLLAPSKVVTDHQWPKHRITGVMFRSKFPNLRVLTVPPNAWPVSVQ